MIRPEEDARTLEGWATVLERSGTYNEAALNTLHRVAEALRLVPSRTTLRAAAANLRDDAVNRASDIDAFADVVAAPGLGGPEGPGPLIAELIREPEPRPADDPLLVAVADVLRLHGAWSEDGKNLKMQLYLDLANTVASTLEAEAWEDQLEELGLDVTDFDRVVDEILAEVNRRVDRLAR